MPNPQELQAFRERMIKSGVSPEHVDVFIHQKLNPQPQQGFPSLDTQAPEQKSVGGFFGNVLSSGANFVKNTASAAVNIFNTDSQKNTLANLGRVGLGAAEKVIPGQQGAEANFDALTGFFKERYGSIDALKNTMYHDPVGFAADLSTVLGGGSAALRGVSAVADAAEATNVASKLASAGNALGKTSELVNPLTGPTAVAKAAIPSKLVSSTAQSIYERALKPSSKLNAQQRAEVILTGLKEGIPVSKGGLMKLDNTIDELNGQLSSVIKKAADNGDTVKLADVQQYTSQLKDLANHSLAPEYFLKQIDGLEKEFMHHPLALQGKLPISVAQKIKVNTYQLLRKSYGEMKGMEIETSKALARGLKEEIATKYPALKAINARESNLLAFEKELEKAVGRIGKADIIDLGTEGAAIAGTIAGGPAGGILAGLAKKVLSMPEIRSKLAILLQKAADRSPTRPGLMRRSLLPAGRLINASQGQIQQ